MINIEHFTISFNNTNVIVLNEIINGQKNLFPHVVSDTSSDMHNRIGYSVILKMKDCVVDDIKKVALLKCRHESKEVRFLCNAILNGEKIVWWSKEKCALVKYNTKISFSDKVYKV